MRRSLGDYARTSSVYKQQNPGLSNHRERINLCSQHFKHVLNTQENIVLIQKEHRRSSNMVTNFIVRDVMPIYTVEKGSFRAMVEALNPRYQLPHKDYFSRTAIPGLHEKTREKTE